MRRERETAEREDACGEGFENGGSGGQKQNAERESMGLEGTGFLGPRLAPFSTT
jgi:hypothetical protein